MNRTLAFIGVVAAALLFHAFIVPVLRLAVPVASPLVPSLIMMLLYGHRRFAVVAGVIAGFLADLTSPFSFGVTCFALLASLGVTLWVSQTRITNRSLSAFLALLGIGLIVYDLSFVLLSLGGQALDHSAIGVQLTSMWLRTSGVLFLEQLALGAVVYGALRIAGRSYATITSGEF